jgi:hypothetical protein
VSRLDAQHILEGVRNEGGVAAYLLPGLTMGQQLTQGVTDHPVSLTWLLWRRITTIPATTSTLPGIAAGETLSPSITNANAAANNGMSSEIVAVATDGNREEAKAKAKLGIAVQSMARPRKIGRLSLPNGVREIVVGSTHLIGISATLPNAKVMKVTLVTPGPC